MQFVSFETLTEFNAFTAFLPNINPSLTSFVHIGASTTVGKSATEWYWKNSGRKVSFAIPWQTGEPNNANNIELCLSLRRDGTNGYKFNDIPCDNYNLYYICQRVAYTVPLI